MSGPQTSSALDWSREAYRAFSDHRIRLVSYVPDAGLKRLIELCQGDAGMRAVPLTTEEEGVGLAMGAWLGGEKSALLLQSSGVGNLVNVLGALRECRLPFLMVVTMRGEEGEFNRWQVPMGRAAPAVLEGMGVRVVRVEEAEEVGPALRQALTRAFEGGQAVALLLAQSLIGIKSFQEQANR